MSHKLAAFLERRIAGNQPHRAFIGAPIISAADVATQVFVAMSPPHCITYDWPEKRVRSLTLLNWSGVSIGPPTWNRTRAL